ncbi:MAG: hypothetical protein BJ554DRAFT_4764 [Olpidium bornovanus]|uniref:Uncharacterized protein n=1 Tax=Olpidium bornovanus TaxID=278681 RepID=A0A8H8A0B3_9FUNG|nr:MAG: hypothetical protein BJ554DRAFT_4764 [Olpidium bornovanus]
MCFCERQTDYVLRSCVAQTKLIVVSGHACTQYGCWARQVKEHQMPLVISTLRTENFSCVDADDEFTEHFGPAGRLDDQLDRNGKSSLRPPFKLQPRRSPSPGSQLLDPFSICEIRRLCRKVVTNHSLRMVGLNRDFFERWGLKLLKILFYPELLDGSTSEIPYSTVSDDSPVDEWRERRLDVSPVG